MKASVVFHLDWDNEDALLMALGNTGNLLKEIAADDAEIYMVANGDAVKLFLRQRAARYADRINDLSEADVDFLVCNNSLVRLDIKPEELLEACRVIPAGIIEIIRLQAEGCAYVKP